MALSENVRLCIDLAFLPFYILWFVCMIRFIIYTPIEEIPLRQGESVTYSIWFLTLVYHTAVMFRDKRLGALVGFFQRLRYMLRDYVLQYLIGSFIWDFLRFLHLRIVCTIANGVLEVFLLSCTLMCAAMVCHLTFCHMDATFYAQNLAFLILYCTAAVRCKDFYNVKKLIGHLAYTCVHLGCVGEYLGYEGSYYAIHFGTILFILYFIWHLLNGSSSGGSQVDTSRGNLPHNGPPPDNPADDSRPDDDADKPSKETQWKPKQQKKRKIAKK